MAKKSTTGTASGAAAITATFVLERETPGAVRYMEVDAKGQQLKGNDGVMGTFYIRKTALKGATPKGFTMTLTPN